MGAKLSAQPASSIVPIGEFDAKGLVGNPGGFIQLLFDASTRASKRIRPQAADFYEIMDELDAQTKASKPALVGRYCTFGHISYYFAVVSHTNSVKC